MLTKFESDSKYPVGLMLLIVAQFFCAVFFLGDVIADYGVVGTGAAARLHFAIEAAAALGLFAAILIETRYLLDLLRRKDRLERSLKTANAAVHDVIEANFDLWALSPSERDVATFLVKGLNTAEIAEARGSAEGTIKAHLNAIYRKSDTRSRADMLSVLIDSMIDGEIRKPDHAAKARVL